VCVCLCAFSLCEILLPLTDPAALSKVARLVHTHTHTHTHTHKAKVQSSTTANTHTHTSNMVCEQLLWIIGYHACDRYTTELQVCVCVCAKFTCVCVCVCVCVCRFFERTCTHTYDTCAHVTSGAISLLRALQLMPSWRYIVSRCVYVCMCVCVCVCMCMCVCVCVLLPCIYDSYFTCFLLIDISH